MQTIFVSYKLSGLIRWDNHDDNVPKGKQEVTKEEMLSSLFEYRALPLACESTMAGFLWDI